MKKVAFLSVTLGVLGVFAAEMRLNPLFSDNMVFAAGKPMRVFGNGDGEAAVRIGEREVRAQSVNSSRVVELPWLFEVGKTYELEVVLNGMARTIHNVRIGEVWLMSGQSNMQFKLKEESGSGTGSVPTHELTHAPLRSAPAGPVPTRPAASAGPVPTPERYETFTFL